MLLKSALSSLPDVRQEMHFDTLWVLALEQLQKHSGQLWTDFADHDPGVTLLQALSYSVSDLAYRHTLALQDLLTPAPQEQNADGLFPAEFGPQQALTVSPVTEDDYRRALLDLTDTDGRFLFRNAQLLRESVSERYRYYFSPDRREFLFNPVGNVNAFTVQGYYRLQLELNRDISREIAEPVVQDFLRSHRNICEGVRAIDWLVVQDVNVTLVLELKDDFQDFPRLMMQIYRAVETHVSPQAQRYTAQQLHQQGIPNELLYQGPMLQHGWITDLPACCDYQSDRLLNINPLAVTLQALEGVMSLHTLGFASGSWTTTIAAYHYPRCWQTDPLQVLADGKLVRLMKRGQQISLTRDEIADAFEPVHKIAERSVLLPYGRHRQARRYYPASAKIPPCYGLQNSPPDSAAFALHQFLLAFEQLLANGCDQLSRLPALLSFQREIEASSQVWGDQWPFASDRVATDLPVDLHADYQQALMTESGQQAQNVEQELRLLNHLLSYFGQQRADRTLLNAPDYLASQRYYLSQNSALYYAAGQFRADAISAIQRRIASRLGFAANLFSESTEMSRLPFYLVEHASLLPRRPSVLYDSDWQPVHEIRQSVDDRLDIHLPFAVSDIYPGQLLELELKYGAVEMIIAACVVLKRSPDYLIVTIEINALIRSFLAELMHAETRVQWRNSNMWLQDINFALNYVDAERQAESMKPAPGEQVITTANFPADLGAGERISIYRHLSPQNPLLQPTSVGDLDARVLSVDILRRQALIAPVGDDLTLPEPQAVARYRWRRKRDEQHPLPDRYSFTVSIVFREDLLSALAEPYTTEAWVRQIVQQELPCHVRGEIFWFDGQYFDQFAQNYALWMAADASLGIYAFNLLEMLGLGLLPSGLLGIDAMRIASAEQRDEVIGDDETQWNTAIIDAYNLFYIPP